jgi:hypothetical protein
MIFQSFSIIKPKPSRRKINIIGLLMALFLFTVNIYICVSIIKLFLKEMHSKELIVLFLSYIFVSVYLVFYITRKYIMTYTVLGTLIFEENGVQIVQGEFTRTLRYLDIRNMILRYSLGYKRGSEKALSYSCEIELINKETLTIEILRNSEVQPKSFWKRRNTIFKVLNEKMHRYKVY